MYLPSNWLGSPMWFLPVQDNRISSPLANRTPSNSFSLIGMTKASLALLSIRGGFVGNSFLKSKEQKSERSL